MKEQIMAGISKWIDKKVDELAADSLYLTLGSNTIKRVLHNLADDYLPEDMLKPLLSNHGVVDANVLADEINATLRNMEQKTISIGGGFAVALGDGVVSIKLPDTPFVSGLMNGIKSINFREEDINELARYINESKIESNV